MTNTNLQEPRDPTRKQRRLQARAERVAVERAAANFLCDDFQLFCDDFLALAEENPDAVWAN